MKQILIIDEDTFSKICAAILELEGYKAEIVKDLNSLKLNTDNFALVIMSYPFGYFLFEDIRKINLPTIVLTDHINKDVVNLLEDLDKSYCMVKPLDYQKFRYLVNQILKGNISDTKEINIL
ncbi:MAG: DNA-binding response regulator [Nitrospirota bacterium]